MLKTLCLIHFWGWMNSLFPLLALWGNKNWPPSMKMKKIEISLHPQRFYSIVGVASALPVLARVLYEKCGAHDAMARWELRGRLMGARSEATAAANGCTAADCSDPLNWGAKQATADGATPPYPVCLGPILEIWGHICWTRLKIGIMVVWTHGRSATT